MNDKFICEDNRYRYIYKITIKSTNQYYIDKHILGYYTDKHTTTYPLIGDTIVTPFYSQKPKP